MTPMPRTWRPIVDGSLRQAAAEVIEDIANALGERALDDPSLSHGSAGVALFFTYRALASRDPVDRELALEVLDRAIEAASGTAQSGELFGGWPGVAWAIEHVTAILDAPAEPDDGDGDGDGDLDRALHERITQTRWGGRFGLATGLVGLGVCALARLPRPGARACVSAVIDELDALAERREGGVAWFTPADDLRELPLVLELAPRGCHDLTTAHGMPGVIGFLTCALAQGVDHLHGHELLAGAVRWLLDRQMPAGSPSVFSRWYFEGPGRIPARAAWCSGDPGIAAILLHAARVTANHAWERDAFAIAHHAARRPLGDASARVHDAGICHGTAGLAHVFNRLYQHTHSEELREASRAWLRRTLDMRRAGSGVAGFTALVSEAWNRPKYPRDDAGVLSGAAGIGLALLAATTGIAPAWDRMLLLS